MFRYDRLDDLIKETGKKKNYLSIKLGHSGRYLNDAKKQNTNIKDAEVQILADELGTTKSYLVGETDKKEKPPATSEGLSPAKQALLDSLPQLSDEQCEALLRIVNEVKKLV